MMTPTKAARIDAAMKAGVPATELAREYGIKPATLYAYLSRYRKKRREAGRE